MMSGITPNQIMAKITELDMEAGIRFGRNSKTPWYLFLRNVVSIINGYFNNIPMIYGESPDKTLLLFWEYVLANFTSDPESFLVVYAHPDGVVIPPREVSQAWVKLDPTTKNWVDVEPTDELLQKRCTNRDKIISCNSQDLHY